MSHEIIKSIQITDDAVYMEADSNNVYPKDFTKRESPYYTEMLRSKGKRAVELDILMRYEDGMFQPGRKNKYSKAIDRLTAMPEYEPFKWWQQLEYKSPEWQALQDRRRSEELVKLVEQAFTTK
jgi:hypothetical protein